MKRFGFDGFVCFANRFYNRFYAVLCGFLAFGPTVFWSSTPAGGGFGLPVFLVVNNGLHPQKIGTSRPRHCQLKLVVNTIWGWLWPRCFVVVNNGLHPENWNFPHQGIVSWSLGWKPFLEVCLGEPESWNQKVWHQRILGRKCGRGEGLILGTGVCKNRYQHKHVILMKFPPHPHIQSWSII